MDPRHPELAVKRIDELVKQYKRVEKDMAAATVSNRLAELEREGVLVVQELCLVAPRLHDALMQASRTRRVALTRTPVKEVRPSTRMMYDFSEAVEKPVENPVEEPKTKAKKATKKKVSK